MRSVAIHRAVIRPIACPAQYLSRLSSGTAFNAGTYCRGSRDDHHHFSEYEVRVVADEELIGLEDPRPVVAVVVKEGRDQ